MDAKTFFRSIRLERREIRILNQRIYAKEMDLLPSGMRYDRDQVQTSLTDRITDKFTELADFERAREKLVKRLARRQAQAIDLISGIPDTRQRQVLEAYYLDDRSPTWEDVADELGYDRRWVLRIHGMALEWINVNAEIPHG